MSNAAKSFDIPSATIQFEAFIIILIVIKKIIKKLLFYEHGCILY